MELPPVPKELPASKPIGKWVLIGVTVVLLAVGGLCVCMPELMSEWFGSISPGCWFRRYTGIACPGCGGTRSTRALLSGDIAGACSWSMCACVLCTCLNAGTGSASATTAYFSKSLPMRLWFGLLSEISWERNKVPGFAEAGASVLRGCSINSICPGEEPCYAQVEAQG